MKTSNSLTNIIPALLKVKSELKGVAKTSDNPYFKSKYANLNDHIEAVEDLLAKNKLVLLQPTGIDEQGTYVESIIFHESGEFVSASMRLVLTKQDMQQAGAAVTYARRFTLGSLLTMKAEDDDGNLASGKDIKATSQSISSNNNTQISATSSSTGFAKPVKKASATTEVLAGVTSAPIGAGGTNPTATKPVSKGAWS